MNEYTIDGRTAAEWEKLAQESEQRGADSFERSDTDGFLSQWASAAIAREYRAKADLCRDNGQGLFPALFTLDGKLVAAKLVETRFGIAWALLESDDPRSRFVGFVNESNANTAKKRAAALARKGYTVGTIRTDAKIQLVGKVTLSAIRVRTDGGFSRDVEIVDVRGFDSRD